MRAFDNDAVFWYFVRTNQTMAGKTKRSVSSKKIAKNIDTDRTRLRRFLYLWLPFICIVLIAFYAAALDPAKPTGVKVQAALVGAGTSPQSTSSNFKVKLDSGEETEIFIPEKQIPPPGSRIVMEEYATFLLKKRSYRYLHIADTSKPSK